VPSFDFFYQRSALSMAIILVVISGVHEISTRLSRNHHSDWRLLALKSLIEEPVRLNAVFSVILGPFGAAKE
jgi:hypothetical protein